MEKSFNITGLCNPDRHYMADMSGKITSIIKMIDRGDYFVINYPRQYGKSTTLLLLEKELLKSGHFLPVKISFEYIDTTIYENYRRFIQTFLGMIKNELNAAGKEKIVNLIDENLGNVHDFFQLDELLDKLNNIEKNIVLMIDEVDNTSNNQLFLDFLGLLRSKYLKRAEGKGNTFHSVILAGVHDIKNLKSKIRTDDRQKYNSPWNIAAKFDIDLGFDVENISSMLKNYVRDKKIAMDIPAAAEKLYYYTNGYPFLVSNICKILDEEILPLKKESSWTIEDIETAVKKILGESNTNFDSLIKNLENNSELYAFIKSIAVEGEQVSYRITDHLIDLAKTYGMLGEENGNCKIHNRIYEQLIYDHMMVNLTRVNKAKTEKASHYNIAGNFLETDGGLNFEKVLLKFQEFMKEQFTQRDREFLERNGRLVFQAFLKPIINGSGFDFKETQVSEERRLDIVVTWGSRKYVVELKTWRGPEAHKRGLAQLSDYLERVNLEKGYLIIFDFRQYKNKKWVSDTVEIDGKEIFAVWV